MERIMKKLCLILVFSSFLIISGCSEKTSDEYIALAETNILQNDIPSAIIELKNAIGINPQDPRSRFMLGNLYAERGSSAAAEKELIRAFELGYEPNEVLPVLANAYSLQFKHAEIIKLVDESRNIAPEVSTSLLLYKALAHFQLGEPYKAKKAVADANEISSDSLYSKLGNAYVDFSNKQIDTSLEKIDEILKAQPDFADAHLLKGQLTSVSKDTKGAVESFEKYKELLPRTYQSRVFLANAYLKNKQFEEAEKEIDLMLKANPEQPYINQLKGAVRFQARDFENAKLYTEKAIQNGLPSFANTTIAGLSAFRLGNFEQAYDHINSIKDQIPNGNPIQKLLIILQIKLGLSDDASEELSELDGLSENDVILLSAATAQSIKNGNFDKAQALVSRAKELEYTNPMNLAHKGMLLLTLDDLNGITDLENALQIEPDLSVGNTALARAYIKNGMFDKAIELANEWINQNPERTNGYLLAAKGYLGLNKLEKAELVYKQVLDIDKANPSANIYFADLYKNSGDLQTAASYLSRILIVYKDNIKALTKYFVVMKELGGTEKALELVRMAYDADSMNSNLQLLYARALFTDEKYNEVINSFNPSNFNENTIDELWTLLSNTQVQLQRLNKAENTLERWLLLKPDNKNAYLDLIVLNDILNNSNKALTLIRQALNKFPEDKKLLTLNVYFYLKSERAVDAKRAYDLLPSEIKNDPIGKGFLGRLFLINGKFNEAIPLLKQYYDSSPTTINATLLATAFKSDNRLKDAIDFLNEHIKQQGESVLAEVQIAELLITNKDYEQAELVYKKILLLEPDNTKALNNLAYLLFLELKYNEALPFAERAAALTPENPSVLDTLSQVLMKTGDTRKALDYAEEAYRLDSSSYKLIVNLAEVLVMTGNKNRALEKLSLIPDSDTEYASKVEALMNQIQLADDY
jgi:putative PEP-CTERM system TPR-repeat lipoprotein